MSIKTQDYIKSSMVSAPKNPKTPRRKRACETKQTRFDSNARVIPKRTHGIGMWGGERKVVNIRIDEKLYKATKPILKRYFGSVCGAIEPYLASIYSIATNTKLDGENGVIPSITVDINNINIRRHLKARRKFVVEEDFEASLVCEYVDCSEVAVGSGFWKNKKEPILLCAEHYEEAEKLFRMWSRVQTLEVTKCLK